MRVSHRMKEPKSLISQEKLQAVRSKLWFMSVGAALSEQYLVPAN